MSTLNLFEDKEKAEKRRNSIISQIGEEWYSKIGDLFDKPYMLKVAGNVAERRRVNKVYPSSSNVFRAYKLTPYSKVRVVILTQDPYYNGLADGLAFSSAGMKTPKSLEVIFKEIHNVYSDFNTKRLPDLSDWASQGVLLINSILTVDENNAGSHAGFGWEDFTTDVIKRLNLNTNRLVFVFWGSKAKAYSKYVTSKFHLVLEANHPIVEEFKTGKFYGNNHFLQIDRFLKEHYGTKIKW